MAESPVSALSFDAEIGARIRRHRTSLGMSQSALGERIGVTFQQVQKYEYGQNRVSVDTLLMIAQTLGVPFLELVPSAKDLSPGRQIEPKDNELLRLAQTLNAEGQVLLLNFAAVLCASPSLRRRRRVGQDGRRLQP